MPRPCRPFGVGVLLILVGALATACGDPNAGYAASTEFESFLDDHPVDGYEASLVRGENLVPFSGSLDVVMSALDPGALGPGDYLGAITSVAEQVCTFSPEAEVTVEYAFAVGAYSTPMACPDVADHDERLADAADLLAELMEVRGVDSIQYGFSGTLDVVAAAGVDLPTLSDTVSVVARRHALALGDEDPYIAVSRPIPQTPGASPS